MLIERELRIWNGMKQRCYNPNNYSWHRYGGRGIKMCDAWRNSFWEFYVDMGPANGLSIERKNNDGNYEPSNCKWATRHEQEKNKTRNNWFKGYEIPPSPLKIRRAKEMQSYKNSQLKV